MKPIDKLFFNFFLKKGKLQLINNKLAYRLFFKLFRTFLKGPFQIQIDGFKLFAYPQKNEPTSGILKRLKFHEATELKFVQRIAKNNHIIFIDAGSNYGHYSLFVAFQNFKNEIISFEPSELIGAQQSKNIKLNNFTNICLENYIIAEKNGIKDFYETGISWEGSIFHNHLKKTKKTQVECISFDKYFENYNFSSNKIIIKLDIEGSEINALYGAKQLISKLKPIFIFEFSKMLIDNPIYSEKEFDIFLRDYNYTFYDFKMNKMSLQELHKRISQLKSNRYTIGNFLLIHDQVRI